MADAFQAARAQAAAVRRNQVGIEVIIPDIPLWAPQRAKDVINSLLLSTVRLALMEIAGWVSQEARVDTGHMAQSFTADPATREGGVEILGRDATTGIMGRVFSSLPYTIVMARGRRPGAPISRDGIDAIGLWAQRKLGLSQKEADRAKWAIAFHIVAQGIEGDDFDAEGFEAARPRVEELFRVLGEEVAAALAGGGTTQATVGGGGTRSATKQRGARGGRFGRGR